MYDLFLKILRDEVNTKPLIDIQRVKVNEYRSYLFNMFYQLSTQSIEAQKYFNQIVKNILRDAELLIRVRLVKNILSSSKPSDSIDTDFYSILDKVVYFMKIFVSSFYTGYDNSLYVVFKKKCIINGRVFEKGDIVKLDPLNSFKLYLSDCIELITKPYIAGFLEKSS